LLFQTKDFDNCLEIYKITETGKLLKEISEMEVVPEEERPYYNKPEWNDPKLSGFFRIFGSLRKNSLGWEETNFTGEVTMYTSRDDEWYEYKLLFVKGKLREVTKVKETT